MNNSQFPSARRSGLVVQEVPDEVLVYDLDTNKAHCLNKTAAAVWQACDGTRSITEIAQNVEKATGGKVSDELVWLAIDQLSENDLLDSKVKANFGGQTRREVLKKIGLASVIALPIVASLVAPSAAMAATSCRCNNPGNPNEQECIDQGVCGVDCGVDGICVGTPPPPPIVKEKEG